HAVACHIGHDTLSKIFQPQVVKLDGHLMFGRRPLQKLVTGMEYGVSIVVECASIRETVPNVNWLRNSI
ncbi:MAG: hypothetical protein VXW22_04395, partial [Pseudomonadota bacterium]|nr:hypothetical protein [Pseudomonadota bacterium]